MKANILKVGDIVKCDLKDLKYYSFRVTAIEGSRVDIVNTTTWASWSVPAKVLYK